MIILPIKRKWFDMIVSGEKKEEYREIKPYYTSRFSKYGEKFEIGIRAGYSKNSPFARLFVELSKGVGREEWGAPKQPVYILSVKDIKNETKRT